MDLRSVSSDAAIVENRHEKQQLSWQRRKMLRNQVKEEDRRRNDAELKESLESNLFDAGDSAMEDAVEQHLRNNLLQHTDYTVDDFELAEAEIAAEGEATDVTDAFLANFSSRYLSEDELENLFKFYGDEKLETESNALLDQLVDSPEGSELGCLNKFIENSGLNKAQIYLMLNYIMESLRQKRMKRRFYKQLQEWLKLYEQQESGYLFEFFSLAANKELQAKFQNNCNLDALAELNSTSVSSQGVKQTITLVSDLFNNQFDNMVSLYMKVRGKQLGVISSKNPSPESKVQLSELIALEKYLMIVHSIYLQHDKFKQKLVKANVVADDVWNESKQNMILTATVSFCESSFASALTIDRLLGEWKMSDLTPILKTRMLHGLILFMHNLPLSLFRDEPKNIQKLVNDVRSVLNDLSKKQAASVADNKTVTFLKAKSSLIKYV